MAFPINVIWTTLKHFLLPLKLLSSEVFPQPPQKEEILVFKDWQTWTVCQSPSWKMMHWLPILFRPLSYRLRRENETWQLWTRSRYDSTLGYRPWRESETWQLWTRSRHNSALSYRLRTESETWQLWTRGCYNSALGYRLRRESETRQLWTRSRHDSALGYRLRRESETWQLWTRSRHDSALGYRLWRKSKTWQLWTVLDMTVIINVLVRVPVASDDFFRSDLLVKDSKRWAIHRGNDSSKGFSILAHLA